VDLDSRRLRIAVTDGRGRPLRATGLQRWLAFVAPVRARGELAIALASNAEVRALNRRYRRKDRPTDVLAFPATDGRKGQGKREKGKDAFPSYRATEPPSHRFLGDIVIATGVARRQAAEAGHSYAAELRILVLHGLLHLLGYDHHGVAERKQMAKVESRLRRKGGLPAGLIERGR
jgi:probable rRNA maturation factor